MASPPLLLGRVMLAILLTTIHFQPRFAGAFSTDILTV